MSTVIHESARGASLDERVAASADRLAPAEEKVARFFAEHREEVAFLSAADVAEVLGTSGATVVRAAQALGYAGFPELKDELRDALRTRTTPITRIGRSLDELGADPDAVLDHVLAGTAELIAETRRAMRPQEFRRAVDVLRRAQRIVVIGLGPNRGLADHVTQGLRRFGKRASLISARGQAMAEDIIELGAGDALLLIAHERVTNEVSVPLDLAKSRGVPVILVTDRLGLALEGRYTAALTALRGGPETYPISAVTLAVLEALLIALAGRDRARTLATFEQINELRRKLSAD